MNSVLRLLLIAGMMPASLLTAGDVSLEITRPDYGTVIIRRDISIEGTSSGLERGTEIKVYVRGARDIDYFQGHALIRADGSWTYYPVIIGAVGDNNFSVDVYAETHGGVRSNFVTVTKRAPAAEHVLEITSPGDGTVVNQRKTSIAGISRGLPEGTELLVYVRTNTLYFQGRTLTQQDGSWEYFPVVLGGSDDNDFTAELLVKTNGGASSPPITVRRYSTTHREDSWVAWNVGEWRASFTPVFIPVEVSYSRSGGVTVRLAGTLRTPIGQFELSRGLHTRRRTLTIWQGSARTVYLLEEGQAYRIRCPVEDADEILIEYRPNNNIDVWIPA